MNALAKLFPKGRKRHEKENDVMPARCIATREPFDIIIERRNDKMVMVRGERPKVSASVGLFSSAGLKTVNIANGLYSDKSYKCPICNNTRIVRCAKCGNITCYNDSGFFKCAYCPNKGEVKGVMKTVNLYSKTKNEGMKPSGLKSDGMKGI